MSAPASLCAARWARIDRGLTRVLKRMEAPARALLGGLPDYESRFCRSQLSTVGEVAANFTVTDPLGPRLRVTETSVGLQASSGNSLESSKTRSDIDPSLSRFGSDKDFLFIASSGGSERVVGAGGAENTDDARSRGGVSASATPIAQPTKEGCES